MSEIDRARAMRRVGSGQHKIARYGEGMLVGAFEHKRPRIGHERGVEAGGNVTIDGNAGQARKVEYELGGGHHRRVDPVDVGKIAPAYVVVDVNKETFIETIEKRAPGAVAFQQDHAIVWWTASARMTRSAKGRF